MSETHETSTENTKHFNHPLDVKITSKDGKGTLSVETYLCWATLLANDAGMFVASLDDAVRYFENIGEECDNCPFQERCPAFLLNA